MSAIIAGSSPLSLLTFHPSFFSLSSLCDNRKIASVNNRIAWSLAPRWYIFPVLDNPKVERKEKNHREISTNNESLTAREHRVHLSRLGFGTQGFHFRWFILCQANSTKVTRRLTISRERFVTRDAMALNCEVSNLLMKEQLAFSTVWLEPRVVGNMSEMESCIHKRGCFTVKQKNNERVERKTEIY